ncbi:proteasome activator complex subunit 3-like isoform X2 [Lates japonicus]|uniref:Proteasome activator complex subunit 3-like isoform X2 n=1 Tax=Lates japonicus TaxID=270547 RepID=A0AAD3RKC0_LATJO|nr:proteasome activator complex subunit 3-like isoform X2 [Lates japonicus]
MDGHCSDSTISTNRETWEDYRRTVSEIDEKEYISLKIIVSELRNQYVTLHDMILKNIEKIKKPRSSNSEALY